MDTDPVPLAYASPEPIAAGFERIRRIFVWFAIGYAVADGLSTLVTVVSLWQISQFRWPAIVFSIAALPLCVPLAIGGWMTLRERVNGPFVVRVAALGLWSTGTLAGSAFQMSMRSSGGMPSFRLGEFTVRVLFVAIAQAFSVPTLLFCLSFPLRRAR